MGKLSKPVSILVTDTALYRSPTMQALKEKGYEVVHLNIEEFDYDLIIGPKCYKILPITDEKKLTAFVGLAIAGARSAKYVKEKK